MDHSVAQFLEELCRLLRITDIEIQQLCAPASESLAFLFPDDDTRQKARDLLDDEEYKDISIRLTRHAATTVVFHLLTLLDERRELGDACVQPRLVLTKDAQEVPVPSFLHELLGGTMQDIGMDTDEWW
ncbi:MAG: hypothetical protein Q9O74_06600 [Planctomycetota bacterium]|nr:hypothetical protein [Planctomycetota bacterium]